jgi:hypothetical protein
MAYHLTASELQVLYELDGAPDKSLRHSTLMSAGCLAAGLTQRGMRTVLSRLENRHLVARDCDTMQLTFGGTRALREAA